MEACRGDVTAATASRNTAGPTKPMVCISLRTRVIGTPRLSMASAIQPTALFITNIVSQGMTV